MRPPLKWILIGLAIVTVLISLITTIVILFVDKKSSPSNLSKYLYNPEPCKIIRKHHESWNSILAKTRFKKPNNLFTAYSDKIHVKSLTPLDVAKTLFIASDPHLIPFDALPKNYVIKPNHLSDAYFIVKGNKMEMNHARKKYAFNPKKIVKECVKWLNQKHTAFGKDEMWYHYIEPKIIVEEFIDIDFELKCHCFNGKVLFIEVKDYNPPSFRCYTPKWERLAVQGRGETIYPGSTPPPKSFGEKIVQVEKAIPANLNYLRLDVFLVGEKIIMNEYTFSPTGFRQEFDPQVFNQYLGSFLRLKRNFPKILNFFTQPHVIVSLTTMPKRIGSVHHTLKSLLSQNYLDFSVRLYIDNGVEVPETLKSMVSKDKRLKILHCSDIGASTKFYYVLSEKPKSLVVCCDDDQLYPPTWLSTLVREASKYNFSAAVTFHGMIWTKNLNEKTQKTIDFNGSSMSTKVASREGKHSLVVSPMGYTGYLIPPIITDFRSQFDNCSNVLKNNKTIQEKQALFELKPNWIVSDDSVIGSICHQNSIPVVLVELPEEVKERNVSEGGLWSMEKRVEQKFGETFADMYRRTFRENDLYPQNTLPQNWLNHFFDQIYAICLPQRHTRLTDLMNSLHLNPKIIPCVTRQDISSEQLALFGTHIYINKLACHLSHLKTIETFLSNPSLKNCIIFEDDVSPVEDVDIFCSVKEAMSNVVDDWDFINFGVCYEECKDTTHLGGNCFDLSRGVCRHAYALSRRGARFIFEKSQVPLTKPGDQTITTLLTKSDLNLYTVRPRPFEQQRQTLGSTLRNYDPCHTCT